MGERKEEKMIEAVIFDLDGTVIDSEGVWEEAFINVISQEGLKVNTVLRQNNGWIHEPGIGLETNWRRLVSGEVDEIRRLSNLTREAYKELTVDNLPPLRKGVGELIEKIKERGWQTALATSTYWYVVEEELEQLSMQLAFDVTTTAEEVLTPKPDPEIYLFTAQKLGVEPKNCIVIEDAIGGVRAGVEAGMKVVALRSDYASEKLMKSCGAWMTVESLDEIVSELNSIE